MQWLRLDEEDRLHALPEAAKYLNSFSKTEPLNLVAIFGSARQVSPLARLPDTFYAVLPRAAENKNRASRS
jgi:hypothetical protein